MIYKLNFIFKIFIIYLLLKKELNIKIVIQSYFFFYFKIKIMKNCFSIIFSYYFNNL